MNEKLLKELNDFLNQNNLELLADSEESIYSIGWKSKINLKCKICDEVFDITVKQLLRPHPVRSGEICPRCEAERLFTNKLLSTYGKIPYEFASKFLGYTSPLTVKCKECGYEFTTNSARNLLMPSDKDNPIPPCKSCSNIKNFKQDISILEEELVKRFGECNYEFISPEDFSGVYSKKKIQVKCKICNDVFEVNPQNLLFPKNGKHYCKNCNLLSKASKAITTKPATSKYSTTQINAANTKLIANPSTTKEFIEWFTDEFKDIAYKLNSTDISKEYPVDIYVPEKKVAISMCILNNNSHYHVGKKFHIDRTYLYSDSDVRLIQIMEDEWESHDIIVKEKIRTILGRNNKNNIYARKCKVVDIDASTKNTFMNNYHIQGEDRAAFAKALEYNGEIVAVMTFIKPRLALGSKTGSTVNEYELSRYASSKHIIGGFSKLLNVIISEHPEIEKIKTFADIRWSDLKNNVYAKNGFVEKHISDPNYWYFDTLNSGKDLRRIHRFNFRKQELVKKFPSVYDSSLTEFQIMDKTSYARIFDCGNLVFEYNVKK